MLSVILNLNLDQAVTDMDGQGAISIFNAFMAVSGLHTKFNHETVITKQVFGEIL